MSKMTIIETKSIQGDILFSDERISKSSGNQNRIGHGNRSFPSFAWKRGRSPWYGSISWCRYESWKQQWSNYCWKEKRIFVSAQGDRFPNAAIRKGIKLSSFIVFKLHVISCFDKNYFHFHIIIGVMKCFSNNMCQLAICIFVFNNIPDTTSTFWYHLAIKRIQTFFVYFLRFLN